MPDSDPCDVEVSADDPARAGHAGNAGNAGNADDSGNEGNGGNGGNEKEELRERAPLPEVDIWLVDGFNALHAVVLGGEDRERFWDRAHRERLIEQLGGGLAAETPIVVVFDGHRPVEGDEAHPSHRLEVVFAPSADDWIVKRARTAQTAEKTNAGAPDRIGVVSNDRKVVGRCRHAGATIVTPAAFMGHLVATSDEAETVEATDESGPRG